MLLFVFELKETTQEEKNFPKLQFFHHFGACCMVRKDSFENDLSCFFFVLLRFGLFIQQHY
jgi:hypothetical protein